MLTCALTRTGVNEFDMVLTLQLFQQMVLQMFQAVCPNTVLGERDLIGKSASQHAMIKLGAYLAEAMQTGDERYSLSMMDMGNTHGVIDARLQLAQEKRLDGGVCALQRKQSGKTYMRTSTDKSRFSHFWFLSE